MALEGDLVQLDRNAGRRSQRHALLLVEVQVDDFQRLKVFPYGVGHAAQLLSLHAVGAVVVRLVGADRGNDEQLIVRLHDNDLLALVVLALGLHLTFRPTSYDPLTFFECVQLAFVCAHIEPLFLPM